MSILSFPIYFQDPASAYAYHLFSVHNDVMWFLIVIIILVYWCLYKIIRDYSWKTYNLTSNSIVKLVFNIIFKYIEIFFLFILINIQYNLFKLYNNCLELLKILKLSTINEFDHNKNIDKDFNIFLYWEKFMIKLVLFYIKFFDRYFGFQHSNIYNSSYLINLDGKNFFDEERNLLDLGLNYIRIGDFIAFRPLSFQHIESLVNARYTSSLIYHYTSNSLFFNRYIIIYTFFLRKKNVYLKYLENLNVYVSKLNFKKFNLKERSTNFFKDKYVKHDVFLKSQEFNHGLTFEYVWAILPSFIIICILAPSLYLIFTSEEDLDPKLTIKVIGHHDIDLMNLIIELISVKC